MSTERAQRGPVLAIILAGLPADPDRRLSILMAALPRMHHDLAFSAPGLS